VFGEGVAVGSVLFTLIAAVGGGYDAMTRPAAGHGFGAFFGDPLGVGWPVLALACGLAGIALSSGLRLWRSERGGGVGHILDELEGTTFQYGMIFTCDGIDVIGGHGDYLLRSPSDGALAGEVIDHGVFDFMFPDGVNESPRRINERPTIDQQQEFRDGIARLCTLLEKHNAIQPRARDRAGNTFVPCVFTDRGREVIVGAEARLAKRRKRRI